MVTTPGANAGWDETWMLSALRAGDESAYEQLVRATAGPLLATARRILGREEDAQDALQEGYLNAMRGLEKFQGGSKLTTWLTRIVINACLMKLRSRKRRPEHQIDDLLPSFDETGHSRKPAGPWKPTETLGIERREMVELVRAKIEELPEGYREAIVVRDIAGLDTEQAAEALGMSVGALKTRLHRARQALRTLLDPHLREEHLT